MVMLVALAALSAPVLVVDKAAVATPPMVAVSAPAGTAKTATRKAAPDFAKMMAMFDKLFPPQPDPEPARLSAARGVSARMWPDGTYGALFDSFVGSMANTVLDLKPADLAMLDDKKAGKATSAPATSPDPTLRDQLRRDDPHFDKRMAAITTAVRAEFARISPLIEPPLREGLSRSLARRFTEAQLAELNAFYQTPTGQVFARESMKMWLDGDVMRSTMSSLPVLMLQFPAAMQRVEAAAKSFPAPPKKKSQERAK